MRTGIISSGSQDYLDVIQPLIIPNTRMGKTPLTGVTYEPWGDITIQIFFLLAVSMVPESLGYLDYAQVQLEGWGRDSWGSR